MLLYLIRHAEAEDIGVAGVTRDFDRPLTVRGRDRQSRALAEAFARAGIVVDAVAASPLVRAHQTAAEFRVGARPELRVVTCDELAIGQAQAGQAVGLPGESTIRRGSPADARGEGSRGRRSHAGPGRVPASG